MRLTRTLGTSLVAVTSAAAGVFFSAAPAFAVTQGTATLVDSGNNAINGGTLSTNFNVGLSGSGNCSGTSSSSPQYFVYSFVVPPPSSGSSLAQELDAITWDANTYSSGSVYPLIDNGGNTYGPSNTSTAGQPLAPAAGNFSFGQLNTALSGASLTQLNGASWEVGYVCESNGQTQDFWGTLVSFDANGNWTVSSGVAAPEVPFAVVLPAAGVGLLGGGLLFARRRHKRETAAA